MAEHRVGRKISNREAVFLTCCDISAEKKHTVVAISVAGKNVYIDTLPGLKEEVSRIFAHWFRKSSVVTSRSEKVELMVHDEKGAKGVCLQSIHRAINKFKGLRSQQWIIAEFSQSALVNMIVSEAFPLDTTAKMGFFEDLTKYILAETIDDFEKHHTGFFLEVMEHIVAMHIARNTAKLYLPPTDKTTFVYQHDAD